MSDSFCFSVLQVGLLRIDVNLFKHNSCSIFLKTNNRIPDFISTSFRWPKNRRDHRHYHQHHLLYDA